MKDLLLRNKENVDSAMFKTVINKIIHCDKVLLEVNSQEKIRLQGNDQQIKNRKSLNSERSLSLHENIEFSIHRSQEIKFGTFADVNRDQGAQDNHSVNENERNILEEDKEAQPILDTNQKIAPKEDENKNKIIEILDQKLEVSLRPKLCRSISRK